MTSYDAARLCELVLALSVAGSTTARGRRLQELIAFLIESLPGVETSRENVFNIGRTEEKDVWLRHAREAAGMPFDDREVPVECKNEKDKTGPDAISWFGEKIRNSGGRDGLLLTAAGLSGGFQSGGHEEIRNQLKKGTRIVVATINDVLGLRDGADFLALLQARHAELRHLQGYKSI
jgi:hypothetical protein